MESILNLHSTNSFSIMFLLFFSFLEVPRYSEPLPPCALSTTLEQEKRRFNNLLYIINQNLDLLCLSLTGDILITPELYNISRAIIQNKVPSEWQVSVTT